MAESNSGKKPQILQAIGFHYRSHSGFRIRELKRLCLLSHRDFFSSYMFQKSLKLKSLVRLFLSLCFSTEIAVFLKGREGGNSGR